MAKYRVWCKELGHATPEDGKLLATGRPQEAAQEWARWYDLSTTEFSIVGGRPMTVFVDDVVTGSRSKWQVAGRPVPEYCARAIT